MALWEAVTTSNKKGVHYEDVFGRGLLTRKSVVPLATLNKRMHRLRACVGSCQAATCMICGWARERRA